MKALTEQTKVWLNIKSIRDQLLNFIGAKTILLITLLIGSSSLIAQNANKSDSLLNLLQKPQSDSLRFDILKELWTISIVPEAKKASEYLTKMEEIEKLNKSHYFTGWIFRTRAYIFNSRNMPDSARYYANNALDEFSKIEYLYGKAKSFSVLGYSYVNSPREKIRYFLKEEEIYNKLKDVKNLSSVCARLSQQYSLLSKNDSARHYADLAIKYAKTANNQDDIGNAYFASFNLYYNLASYENATTAALAALNCFEQADNKYQFLNTLIGLTNLFSNSKNFEKSLYYAHKAIRFDEIYNISKLKVYLFLAVGGAYQNKSLIDSALYFYNEGLTFSREQKNRLSEAVYLDAIGKILIKKKEYLTALNNITEALVITQKPNLQNYYYEMLHTKATCFQAMGNYDSAVYLGLLVYHYADSVNDILLKSEISAFIYSVMKEKGDYHEALRYLEEYKTYSDSTFTNQMQKSVSEMTTKYETEKKEQQIILLENEKKLSEIDVRLKTELIEKQKLSDIEKSQKLYLLTKENEINFLNARQKEQDITNQKNEIEKRQKEVLFLVNENKLKSELAIQQKLLNSFAILSIVLILIVGGYSFYRFRKIKKLENQQSLLNERLRISRELHDDMGSTLSSISVYSEVAKNRATKNENETEVLQKIGTASRELIEKMSDIVWSLNPNNENFEQLKNRMMAFAAMMLTPKGILFEFDIDDEVKSAAIAPEQRKNIFLIYKEAVNNIVKYSEATSVKVKLKVKENKLSLEVIDNGKGFDTNNVVAYNGNGLKNMKARAEEIKALFNVTSRINVGTGIELSFNL